MLGREACSWRGYTMKPLVAALGSQVASSLLGFLSSQEACDPKTLGFCQRFWPAAEEWDEGRWEEGKGWNPPLDAFSETVPCPVRGWKRWQKWQQRGLGMPQ